MIDTKTRIASIDEANQEAWKIVRTQPGKALESANKTLAQSEEQGYPIGIAWAKAVIGASNIWLGHYDEAMQYCLESAEELIECDEKEGAVDTNYNIALLFYFLDDHDKQSYYFQKSLDLAKEIDYSAGIANALNGFGTSCYGKNMPEKGLEYLKEALTYAEKSADKSVIARIYDGIGQCYYLLGEFDSAIAYRKKVLDVLSNDDSPQVVSYAHEGLGDIYTRTGDYENALEHFRQSLTLRGGSGFKLGLTQTTLKIAELHFSMGNLDEALRYFKSALVVAEEIDSDEFIYKSHLGLSNVYEKQENLTLFARHFRAYHEALERFNDKREAKKFKAVELKSEFEKVQLEKEELEKKNKVLQQYFEDVRMLSSIGNEITSTLDLDSIFNIIYERINSLMSANGIFIGICDHDKHKIEVPLAIDKGVRDKYFEYPLTEEINSLPVWSVVNAKDVHISDYEEEIGNYLPNGEDFISERPSSVIIIPFVVKDKVTGLLYAQSYDKKAFSRHHFNILRSFANYIAIAIENAALYKDMEQKVAERTAEVEQAYRDQERLNDIGQELMSTLNFEDVFDQLYKHVNEMMDATIFGVRLYDKEKQTVEYTYGYERGERLDKIIVPMSNKDNYSVWCIDHKEPIHIGDNETEYVKYVGEVNVVSGDFPHSLIFYPLIKGDEVLGLITVQCFEKYAYSDYHFSIVEALAHFTILAFENARSYELMEERVQERTEELQYQAAKIEQSYKNTQLLSEIGKEISSLLSSSEIIESAYKSVNDIMDATIFGIGIYREKENDIYFSGAMEKGVRLGDFAYDVNDQRIATLCFRECKEFVINDWGQEYLNYVAKDYSAAQGEMPESMIYMPLISKGKTIGVFTVQTFEKNAYEDYHQDMIRSLSVYIAGALENASLYADMESRVIERTVELEQFYRNAETLNSIGQDLIKTLNFEDTFEQLYQNVNKLMDANVFGVRVLDEEAGVVRYRYEYEKGERLDEFEISLSNKKNLSVWVIDNNKEIVADNIMQEAGKFIEHTPEVVEGEITNSVIFYPLRSSIHEGKVIGVISVQSFKEAAYNEYHLNIVKTLAQYATIAFENAVRYEEMEKRVDERTSEIQKSYENTKLLSEIGKTITSQITVEGIIQVAYNQINQLMDAEGFGIGVFNKENNSIDFHGFIESGHALPFGSSNLETDNDRLAVVCFNREEDIHIDDLSQEYSKYVSEYLPPKHGKPCLSIIYLPIYSKDEKIGVITVQSFENNAYSDYHLDIVKTIGVYAGIALDNASLYASMEDRVKERTEEIEKAHHDTKLISQISKTISESLNIETIISRVYENVNTLMDATCFGVGIYREERNAIVMPGFIENGVEMEEFSYSLEDERLATWCFNNSKEIFINNYFEEYESYIKGIQAPVSGKDSSSIIYIPLMQKDKKIGVLTVQSYELNAYTEYHLDILRSLANSIATAIDNARLYENLEAEVEKQTAEVVKQKEQIEKTFENTKLLSEIGKSITSEITVEAIIEVVYDRINKLMDAEGFGLGIFNEQKNCISFPGYIESGKRLADIDYDLVKDKDRLSCVCFNQDREIKIDNLEEEYHEFMDQYLPPVNGKACVSIIYLPIYAKDRKIGVITVQSFQKYIYTDYHFDIMRTLAVYAGIALDNAGLYANMEERVRERTAEIEKAHQDTKLIGQISKDIAESLNVETIIAKVYRSVNNLMDASGFGIMISDESANLLRVPGYVENGERFEDFTFDLNDQNRFATWCFHNRKEIHINNYFEEYSKYISLETPPVQGEGTNSIIYLPLELKDKVIGVITVQSFELNAYTDYHVSILRSLATTIASALENALLYESLEDKVTERTLELLKQKEIIEEKNKNITDSIIYAKRIQDATLPDIGLVRSYLQKSFVLFRPKDIVSGDFYWIEKVGNKILFAVCDCTGHGVPGAFLSLIGHNALNQIVKELKITVPGKILDELNRKVHRTLQNSLEKNSIKDGMDMAFCALDLDTNVVEFAGAYNPLYIIRDKQIEVVPGDKMAIGSHSEEPFSFETKSIQLEEGDNIYLFSDGYADQFGGDKGKKFKYSRFKELLVSIEEKSMEEQHEILCETMDIWQGGLEQLDDLCVMGYKV